jgi:hypothetical protein
LGSGSAPGCEAIKEPLAAASTFGNLAVWSFVMGGVLGAGTALYWLTVPKSTIKSTVQAVPVANAYSGGVVIIGRW